MKLDDVNDALEIELESEDYDTIGGIMIEQLDRLPEDGEEITLENGMKLQVQGMNQNRISKVLLTLPAPVEETPDAAEDEATSQNEADLQNEVTLQDEADLPNEPDLQNETVPQNEDDLQNEAALQNVATLQHETALQNVATSQNEAALQNMATSQNEAALQNVATLQNEAVLQNVATLQNEVDLQNVATSQNETDLQGTDSDVNGKTADHATNIKNDTPTAPHTSPKGTASTEFDASEEVIAAQELM